MVFETAAGRIELELVTFGPYKGPNSGPIRASCCWYCMFLAM